MCIKKEIFLLLFFFLVLKSNLGCCVLPNYLRPTVPIGLAACLAMISMYGAPVPLRRCI